LGWYKKGMWTAFDADMRLLRTDYPIHDSYTVLETMRNTLVKTGSTVVNKHYTPSIGDDNIKYLVYVSESEFKIYDNHCISSFSRMLLRTTPGSIFDSFQAMSDFQNLRPNPRPFFFDHCNLCHYNIDASNRKDGYSICLNCDKKYMIYIKNRCKIALTLISSINILEDIQTVIKRTFISIVKHNASYMFQ
jgi:hypothetical protein